MFFPGCIRGNCVFFFQGVLSVCSIWLDTMTCLSGFLPLLAGYGCGTFCVISMGVAMLGSAKNPRRSHFASTVNAVVEGTRVYLFAQISHRK